MSINLENPETVLGKIDAAGNFVAQIRLALMIGDIATANRAVEQAERHIYNAMVQIEECDEKLDVAKTLLKLSEIVA